MGTKEIIGHIDCPVCGFEAPVKADRNGHAYAHCAHSCQAQVFTRNAHRDSLLRRRMRPVSVTVTGGDEPDPVSPKPAALQEPKPLQIPVLAPSTPPAPAAKPPRASPPAPMPDRKDPPPADQPRRNWLTPLMGGANGPA